MRNERSLIESNFFARKSDVISNIFFAFRSNLFVKENSAALNKTNKNQYNDPVYGMVLFKYCKLTLASYSNDQI